MRHVSMWTSYDPVSMHLARAYENYLENRIKRQFLINYTRSLYRMCKKKMEDSATVEKSIRE